MKTERKFKLREKVINTQNGETGGIRYGLGGDRWKQGLTYYNAYNKISSEAIKKMIPKGIKSTETVAALCKCEQITARRWAAANGVPFIGSGYHKNYLWTDADIERFKARSKPGRRWPKKEQGD